MFPKGDLGLGAKTVSRRIFHRVVWSFLRQMSRMFVLHDWQLNISVFIGESRVYVWTLLQEGLPICYRPATSTWPCACTRKRVSMTGAAKIIRTESDLDVW